MPRRIHERADVVPLLAEVFREFGFEGASLARITERTGLGKGSLYHFFPGGKEEMAAAVLAEIDGWFEREVYRPLRENEPRAAIAAMIRSVDAYFRSGGRACLVGAFALDGTRDRFAAAIAGYFERWIEALAGALERAGRPPREAAEDAADAVLGVQGALVLSRALGDPAVFAGALERISRRLENFPE